MNRLLIGCPKGYVLTPENGGQFWILETYEKEYVFRSEQEARDKIKELGLQ